MLLILTIVSASCQRPSEFQIDPLIRSEYESFIRQAQVHGTCLDDPTNLVISIEPNIAAKYQAIAVTIKDDQHKILIDQEYYNRHSEKMQWVVWHELGHCLLNRPHIDGESIMNPRTILLDDCRNLTDELFDTK